ncbi:MAG: c-type cytochrome [Aureliella sp.]
MADQKRLESQELHAGLDAVHPNRAAPLHTIPAARELSGSMRTGRMQGNESSGKSAAATEPASTAAAKKTFSPEDMSAEELRATLERGRERFSIYCAPCHDSIGSGNGMVARRGMVHPPSYHTSHLRSQPIDYIYGVATNGRANMPPYRDQIAEADRWAIAAYVRALQLSQFASREQLESADLAALEKAGRSAGQRAGQFADAKGQESP